AKDHGERLLKHTHGLFLLGQAAIRELTASEGHDWSDSAVADVVTAALTATPGAAVRLKVPLLREAASRLLELRDGETIEWEPAVSLLSEDVVLSPLFEDGGDRFREWLQAVGLAGALRGDRRLQIAPFLS